MGLSIVNKQLEKEPHVEVLRAVVVARKAPDKQQVWGRNPRALQFQGHDGEPSVLAGPMYSLLPTRTGHRLLQPFPRSLQEARGLVSSAGCRTR